MHDAVMGLGKQIGAVAAVRIDAAIAHGEAVILIGRAWPARAWRLVRTVGILKAIVVAAVRRANAWSGQERSNEPRDAETLRLFIGQLDVEEE